jgi:hypothetical protein
MKKVLLFLVLLFLFVPSSYALVGLGLGVRAGVVSNYDNPKLGDFIEEMNMLGAHLKIGALPIIDLEISGEYFWKTEDISVELGSDTISGEFKVRDYSLNGTAKYVFSTPVVKPYIGAGGGLHIITYSFSKEEYFNELGITDAQTKPGYHFNAGLLLNVPVFPLEAFVEGRYTSIQTEKKATGFFTWMLGVTLNLP